MMTMDDVKIHSIEENLELSPTIPRATPLISGQTWRDALSES